MDQPSWFSEPVSSWAADTPSPRQIAMLAVASLVSDAFKRKRNVIKAKLRRLNAIKSCSVTTFIKRNNKKMMISIGFLILVVHYGAFLPDIHRLFVHAHHILHGSILMRHSRHVPCWIDAGKPWVRLRRWVKCGCRHRLRGKTFRGHLVRRVSLQRRRRSKLLQKVCIVVVLLSNDGVEVGIDVQWVSRSQLRSGERQEVVKLRYVLGE